MAGAIWCTAAMTLDVMQEFALHDFKHHPVLANNCIEFMAENQHSDDVNVFDQQVDELKAAVKKLNAEMESLKKGNDVGTNKAAQGIADAKKVSDKLDRDLEKMDSWVRASEEKG